jgi:hypothetical protein
VAPAARGGRLAARRSAAQAALPALRCWLLAPEMLPKVSLVSVALKISERYRWQKIKMEAASIL